MATKRALRAVVKGADVIAKDPDGSARFMVDRGFTPTTSNTPVTSSRRFPYDTLAGLRPGRQRALLCPAPQGGRTHQEHPGRDPRTGDGLPLPHTAEEGTPHRLVAKGSHGKQGHQPRQPPDTAAGRGRVGAGGRRRQPAAGVLGGTAETAKPAQPGPTARWRRPPSGCPSFRRSPASRPRPWPSPSCGRRGSPTSSTRTLGTGAFAASLAAGEIDIVDGLRRHDPRCASTPAILW